MGEKTFFTKVGHTRILPLGLKILAIFVCLILFSNFATNYISLQLSKREVITLNNTIMIEHGNGIVTLYGHNESLAVGVGQHVNQGDVIDYCGSTGNSTGPHCHFEVRLGGEPVSPWDYL